MLFFLWLLAVQTVALARPVMRAGRADFFSPTAGGGSFLNRVSAPLGEPLNVIISGLSSPEVLTVDGFVNYARAVGFSTECLGFHLGRPQLANLGDGNGWVGETMVMREHFGNINFGTCIESIVGGNHFRVYRQNGPKANSGAIFLAVSREKNAAHHHDIVPNGYNDGRDSFVAGAVGIKKYGDITYKTVAKRIPLAMAAGRAKVNHAIATDGTVVLLTVTIVSE